MRKKLLALLMCATMVLGTAATASAATPSSADYTNAKKVLKAWSDQYISAEYDAKTAPITFTTTYTEGSTVINYTYAFENASGSYVKVNPSSTDTKWTKTTGTGVDLNSLDDSAGYLTVAKNKSIALHDVVKVENSLYFVSALDNATLEADATSLTLDANQYIVAYVDSNGAYVYGTDHGSTIAAGNTANTFSTWDANANLAAGTAVKDATTGKVTYTLGTAIANPVSYKVVTLTKFEAAKTGTNLNGDDSDKNAYGIDKDGYIALAQANKITFKADTTTAKGYYTVVSAADVANVTAVAQALADGTISSNAAAVTLDFYTTATSPAYSVSAGTASGKAYATGATQVGFFSLVPVQAAVGDTNITFKADWLSRSNVKNANVVYLLDPRVSSITSYFQQINTVWKIADMDGDTFTSKYIASGTYIFDYVEDASQNDGVSDTDTTTTITAAAATSAETAASSPKTGDVAPIAALAVVMMGACGAMVVASKKRA